MQPQHLVRPPGPESVSSPLGVLRYFWALSRGQIEFTGRRFETYGDIYLAPLRDLDLYVTRRPEHIHKVLVTDGQSFKKTEKGTAARRLHQVLGNSLVNANGDIWRRNRRMINPALRRRVISRYAETIIEHTHERVREWSDGDWVEVGPAMTDLTLSIVCRTLFDHRAVVASDEVATALDSLRSFFTGVGAALPDHVPWPGRKTSLSRLRRLEELVYDMIDERAALTPEELESRGDLLSMLVLAVDDSDTSETDDASRFSRTQLRNEILTLFFAGHETTSQALTWTLELLGRHPAVAEKVRAEVDSISPDGSPITLADSDRLIWVSAAIDEAMRLFPPIPTMSRTAVADVDLGDFVVPKDAEIILSIWWAQHDARWFDEPDAFRPERFVGAAAKAIRPGSYLPFGAGQRTCIGKHFALMEARLILANILLKVELEPLLPWPATPIQGITLSPTGGLPARVHRR